MAKKYRVVVFGKSGCPKCKVLNQRLDALLEKQEWEQFEKAYRSLDTEDGLVDFCKAECIDPQRIPAFYVAERQESGEYVQMANPRPGEDSLEYAHSRLHHILGLQTDYTEKGSGVISPNMIKSVLEEAVP